MSRSDELPPDQRATLSLLLRQRKSYADVASMLGISEGAVHDRAHAALAVLAPRQARELNAERRSEIADYILGQQAGLGERVRTRTFLSGSDAGRAWAHALTAELAELADGSLPEIPPAASASAAGPASGEDRLREAAENAISEDTFSPSSALPSSRVGGALLLAVIVAAIVVAIVLLNEGGSSSHKTATTTTTTKTTTGARETARIALHSPSRISRSIGVVQIIGEGETRAFYVVAEHMSPSRGFFYAVWLYNSPTSALALGKAPPVGSNERLEGGGRLPSNAATFQDILVTRETSIHATHPGRVVLRGRFTVGA
jgi:hypothetical protein